MRITRQGKNQVVVIFTLTEIATIEYLRKSGEFVHFGSTVELVEKSLANAHEYLKRYQGVAEHGNTPA